MDGQWLDEAERTAWLTFARSAGRLTEELERELYEAHGLLLGDYEILVSLSHAGGCGLRMSELAERVLWSRSRLTHRMNRLEEQGLVKRQACETDRRGAFALLTETGRERLVKAAPTHVAGLRRHLIERLDRSELEELTRVLAKVLQGLGEQAPVRGLVGIGTPGR